MDNDTQNQDNYIIFDGPENIEEIMEKLRKKSEEEQRKKEKASEK